MEALNYQDENMGVTHLFFYEDELVGFVTISMTYVEKKEIPDPKRLDYYGRKKPPAMLIGQLGVDNDARGRGLGRVLCNWSEGKAIELSSEIGCRYLVLHTEQDLIAFYEKIGFETRKPEIDADTDKAGRLYYLDMTFDMLHRYSDVSLSGVNLFAFLNKLIISWLNLISSKYVIKCDLLLK